MSVKILKKRYLDIDCVTAARNRVVRLYETFDKVIVYFSGGKDSTALLYLTIEAAREAGKLPVEAVYMDHEIEGQGTTELCEAIRLMPDVKLSWFAVPFRLRNSTNSDCPYWYPWHPQERGLWCREKPEHALTEMPGHVFEYDPDYQHPEGLPYKAQGVKRCLDFTELSHLYSKNYERQGLTTISLVGIRAQESLARYSIMTRKKTECYMSAADSTAYPIYDWEATDVWKFIRESGRPYNVEYDLMNRTELHNSLNKQRVGSIFGEESLRTLHQWPTFYGEYWHRILDRAEGVKTAWRYNNDGIYTGTKPEKRPDLTWKEYTEILLSRMSPKNRALCKKQINKVMQVHIGKTDFPISDKEVDACPLTGISWEFLCRVAIRGDSKERQLQKTPQLAVAAHKRAGMTRDECVELYGKPEYKKKYFDEKRIALQTSGRPDNAASKVTMVTP